MKEDISYQEYRNHLTKMVFRKKTIKTLYFEKQKEFKIYRLAFQKYREIDVKIKELTEELMELIPDKI